MLVVRVLLPEPDLVPDAEPVAEEADPVVPDADALELTEEVLSSVAAAVSLADAVGLAS